VTPLSKPTSNKSNEQDNKERPAPKEVLPQGAGRDVNNKKNELPCLIQAHMTSMANRLVEFQKA
jgi:hypothetical protein